MSKSIKKQTVFLASLLLAATAITGISTWNTGNKTASAASGLLSYDGNTPAESLITNIEDLIDDYADFQVGSPGAWRYHPTDDSTDNDADDVINANGGHFQISTYEQSDVRQGEVITEVGNAYGGNIYGKGTEGVGSTTYWLLNSNDDTVVRFNMRWWGNRMTFYSRASMESYASAVAPDAPSGSSGYYAWWRPGVNMVLGMHDNTNSNAWTASGGVKDCPDAEIGDLLTITFGVTTQDNGTADNSADDYDFLYFRADKVDETTGNKTKLVEYGLKNDVPSEVYYPNEQRYTVLSFGELYGTSAKFPITIEGVERPLFDISNNASGEYWDGENVANVTLPNGYTLNDSSGTLVEGRNVLNATFNGTYYGKAYQTNNASVVVNTVNKNITLDESYPYGTALSSIELPDGYAFNVETTKLTKIGTQTFSATYTEGNRSCACDITVNVTRTVKNIEDVVDDASDFAISNYIMGWWHNEYNSVLNDEPINHGAVATYHLTTKAQEGVTEYNGNLVSKATNGTTGYFLLNTHNNSTTSVITKLSMEEGKGNIVLRLRASVGENSKSGLHPEHNTTDGYSIWIRPWTSHAIFYYASAQSNTVQWNAPWGFTSGLNDGDTVKYTFGVTTYDNGTIDTSDDIDTVYLAIYKINTATGEETLAAEYSYELASSLVYYQNENDTTNRYSAICFGRYSSNANELDRYIAFEGVNRPMLASEYATTAEGTYREGALLSTVELPSGYAWKNDNVELDGDVSEYAAEYTMNYYGKTAVLPVNVKVNVSSIRNTVIFKRADGTEISRQNYKSNETVTLPTATLSTGKTVVLGWLNSEKLYPVNYSYSVGSLSENTETIYTLVEISFKMEAGAAVRLVTDEENNGGLRFMLKSSDVSAWSQYVNGIYGVMVPYETAYFTDGKFTDASLAYAQELTNNAYTSNEAEFTGYTLYSFAMTDIKYSNYNRQFVGGAYITVAYENGEAKVFTPFAEKDNVRSIYDVALRAYAGHLAKMEEQEAAGEEAVGLYGGTKLALLKDYIFDVVDIQVESSTGAVSVSEGTNGLLDELPYTVTGTATGDETVEISITVTDMPEVVNESTIPVIVRVFKESEYMATYRAVKPTCVKNLDGTYTITFTLTVDNIYVDIDD